MKTLFSLLLALLSASFFAQSIHGTVSQKNDKSSYAEITATQDKYKASAISDEKGKYTLALKNNGSYEVSVFIDGEKSASKKVEVNGDTAVDFIIEKPAAEASPEKKLEGVTVTAKKKIFERKVDRLVYNVENSVASQGVDGVEALSKTPMLRVKDDAISIAGKSNVSVLVNDRPLNLSGQDLTNYLKNLRSDDIQRIEVITTPPAKYAAEGSSGIINIVLKKNTKIGWSGSLRLSGGMRKKFSYSDGATINYQGKKLSFTGVTGIGEYNGQNDFTNNATGNNFYWNTDGSGYYRYRYSETNVKAEYKISDNHTAGIGFTYNPARPVFVNDGNTEFFINNVLTKYASHTDQTQKDDNYNTNAFYEIKLDSVGSKINFSGNFMTNKSGADNRIATFATENLYAQSLNNSLYKIINGQIDLEKNFTKIKTEAGLKYAKINNTAQLNYFDIINEIYTPNANRSNDFEYLEQNFAAYASTSFKLSEKWDTKIGLRYEYTTTEGILKQYSQTNKNHYGKLFPTLYISYKPDDNNALSFNYSRRIQRPYFGNLNPFRSYSSNYEYWSGNPYLKPSFTDNIELSYVLKNNFTTSFYASKTNNENGEMQHIEDGLRYSTIENFYDSKRAGINMNYNFTKWKWLEANLSAGGYYSKSVAHDASVVAQEGLGGNLNADTNFFLNKAKTLTYYLGFFMDAPSKSGNSRNEGYKFAYTGMKANLMDKNLTINLTFNDLLNSGSWKGRDFYADYTTQYVYKSYNRGIQLSATYRFGNQNVQGATRQIKNDEQGRNGGGKGGK